LSEQRGLPAGIRDITADRIDVLADVVAELTDADLVRGTDCAGWLVAHLLVHVRLGAAEYAAGFTDQTDLPPDRDFASYWRDFPYSPEPVTYPQVRWLWGITAAYAAGDGLREHFADTAATAAAASRNAQPGRYHFQGHVMEAEDLIAIWTTEFALHHLDLISGLPGRPGPLPEAVQVAAQTLDVLVSGGRPPWWDDVTYLRKGTGRRRLDERDLAFLADRAAGYPAFG
jgi:uncharacterized protein (TIGR03083 family)